MRNYHSTNSGLSTVSTPVGHRQAVVAAWGAPCTACKCLAVQVVVDPAPVQGSAVRRLATKGCVVRGPGRSLIVAAGVGHNPQTCYQVHGLCRVVGRQDGGEGGITFCPQRGVCDELTPWPLRVTAAGLKGFDAPRLQQQLSHVDVFQVPDPPYQLRWDHVAAGEIMEHGRVDWRRARARERGNHHRGGDGTGNARVGWPPRPKCRGRRPGRQTKLA